MRAIIIPAIILASPSCILNVLDTSDRLDRKNGRILDAQKNRNQYIDSYDRMLAQERQGISAPPGFKNWDAAWEKVYSALASSSAMDNPRFYIDYIKGRRKKLGLPRR